MASNSIYRISLGALYLAVGALHGYSNHVHAEELPMRAAGIISFGSQRNAIVELQPGQREEIFQEGSTIPGGFILKKIMHDRLILEKNGEVSILPFLNGPISVGENNMLAQPNLSQPDWLLNQIPPANNASGDAMPANVIDYLMPKS